MNKQTLLANLLGSVEGFGERKPSKGMPDWFLAYADIPAAKPVKTGIKGMKPAKPAVHMVGQTA